MNKPLCIDLFCGLGGWTEGFLAEGYEVIGFDVEQHVYGEHRYPGHLVIQDVRTLHGSQFKDAAVIVASSPCQEYSYMAMPWTRAKDKAKAIRADTTGEALRKLNELFIQARRIQREASEAAGHHIPMIQENVKGAQPWVGKAAWHYGSYYLWGDVPALMPVTMRAQKYNPDGTAHGVGSWFAVADSKNRGASAVKVPGMDWSKYGQPGYKAVAFNDAAIRQARSDDGRKNDGGSWFTIGSPGQKETNNNPDGRSEHRQLSPAWRAKHYDETAKAALGDGHDEGVKGFTPHGQPLGKNELGRKHGSKSKARKAASAKIAKIPFPLARHIAQVYYPKTGDAGA